MTYRHRRWFGETGRGGSGRAGWSTVLSVSLPPRLYIYTGPGLGHVLHAVSRSQVKMKTSLQHAGGALEFTRRPRAVHIYSSYILYVAVYRKKIKTFSLIFVVIIKWYPTNWYRGESDQRSDDVNSAVLSFFYILIFSRFKLHITVTMPTLSVLAKYIYCELRWTIRLS